MSEQNEVPKRPSDSNSMLGVAIKLYRPPFKFDRGYIFDADSRMVYDNNGMDTMGRVRGWGRIQYLPNPEELQDKVGEMIAEALNDFWKKQSTDEMVLKERFDAIERALSELDRLKVAYAHQLQSDVQPPNINVITSAGMALRELRDELNP